MELAFISLTMSAALCHRWHFLPLNNFPSSPSAMTLLLSPAGLFWATVTVAATTLDDAIWLVPYVGSSSWSLSARVTHAVTFVLTLESLAIASVVAAFIVASSVSVTSINDTEEQELLLGSIAALLCWSLAAFFYARKLLKRRRRRQQQEQQQEQQIQEQGETTTLVSSTTDGTKKANVHTTNGPTSYESNASTENHQNNNEPPFNEDEQPHKPLTCGNIGTVISLTFLGALDELSYFPALILGKIFTPLEICLGTLLAAILVLILVTCFLARFQPLMDCLDRIPIYAVIALFAVILTVGVLLDLKGK